MHDDHNDKNLCRRSIYFIPGFHESLKVEISPLRAIAGFREIVQRYNQNHFSIFEKF